MRNCTLYTAAMLAFAPLAPAALVAQNPAGSAGASAGSSANAGSNADARIEAALATALQAGIPVALLERKVAEGKAKGVPMARIAAAVETRLTALTKARNAMLDAGLASTTEGELSVAADAVQAGVSDAALVSISRSSPPEQRAVAVAVLTDLVTLGEASGRAMTQVQAALARGPEALANLRAESAGRLQAGGAGGATGAGVQVGAGAGARVELGAPRGK